MGWNDRVGLELRGLQDLGGTVRMSHISSIVLRGCADSQLCQLAFTGIATAAGGRGQYRIIV